VSGTAGNTVTDASSPTRSPIRLRSHPTVTPQSFKRGRIDESNRRHRISEIAIRGVWIPAVLPE